MTAEKRAQLLRARLPAKPFARYVPRGLAQAKQPSQPAKPKAPRNISVRREFPMYSIWNRNCEIEPQWVKIPDPEVERPLGERKKQKVSALTKISHQLPLKLKRIEDWEAKCLGR